ncbi:MAG: substrate-binding domain-containing protein [Planctomycetaceae bacterium]|nr:substrate-binding domain-containing protein [Planctomycetaceae bacterium]
MKRMVLCIAAALMLLPAAARAGEEIKIGYLVKQPEEQWFQMEWKFAQACADHYGFTLLKIGATDGEKVLNAIDNIAANGAQGFVCVTPDVRLGPAIVAKAKANNLKLVSNADQFIGADGQPMLDVPYLGIAAYAIGRNVGDELWREMQNRGWKAEETGLCVMTFDELDTVRQRYEGAVDSMMDKGFPQDHVYRAPIMQSMDIPNAINAANVLLSRNPNITKWLIAGGNDNCVLGAVRAMEGRGLRPADMVGIGINGTDCIIELEKPTETGFFGSMLLSARQHGWGATEFVYKWVTEGIEPPKDFRTEGVFITRANFRQVLKDEGFTD